MMWMIPFLFLLPLSALAYTLWHVWCLLPLSVVWKAAVVAVCVAAFLTLFVCMSRVLDRVPMRFATVVYGIGTSNMMVMLYAPMLFLLLDMLRLVRVIPATALRNNACVTVVMLAVLVAVFAYGNFHYHRKVRQSLALTTRKGVGEEVRLLMVSDLHIGYLIRRGELGRWVDMINAEQPDIILMAGDLVDRSMRPLIEEDMAAELRRLKAPVYACLGNHEYFCGVEESMAFYRDAGITLLRDSAATWHGLRIVGRDDRTNPRRKSIDDLMQDAEGDNCYTILLDHQPFDIEATAQAGVDFQFSGHTHHGQLFPLSLVTDAIYTVAHGPYSIGDTQYFVSSGLGIWGGKFRIGTCSEYVVATLRRE